MDKKKVGIIGAIGLATLVLMQTKEGGTAPPGGGSGIVYTCPYCTLSFDTPEDLATHIALEHPQLTYDCPYCDWTFDTPEDLATHIALEHPTYIEEGEVYYESISSGTVQYAGDSVLMKAQVVNTTNQNVTFVALITCSAWSVEPQTITVLANSQNVARWNVVFPNAGTYTVYAGEISESFNVIENTYVPSYSGPYVVETSPGNYDLINSDGTVRGTVLITSSIITFYGTTLGGETSRHAGTFDYDYQVASIRYEAAKPAPYTYNADGQYQWEQMLGKYYSWIRSGLPLEEYYATQNPYSVENSLGGYDRWFLDLIPSYCPFTAIP